MADDTWPQQGADDISHPTIVSNQTLKTALMSQSRQDPCRRHWSLVLSDEWIWELDSSSPAKWSRHLIVACPSHAFPNNLVMGDFVRNLLTPSEVPPLQNSTYALGIARSAPTLPVT
jgi:hypothetical protein